jgi:hypothetical protein
VVAENRVHMPVPNVVDHAVVVGSTFP